MTHQTATEETVKRVIAMHRAGTRNSTIAREVGLSKMHIGRIVKGRCKVWAHLLEDTNGKEATEETGEA